MTVRHSPFERLRERYDEVELECRQCGYRDDDGGWSVTTTGSRVRYRFVCPVCDAVETRELRIGS